MVRRAGRLNNEGGHGVRVDMRPERHSNQLEA